MLRFLRYIAEFVAGFVGIVLILAVLVAWRLSTKPVSSDLLTPYIEAGVESIVPGSTARVSSTILTWDNAERLISMRATDIVIDDAQGGEIANIPSLQASISVIGLLFGQFMPKDLTIDHPQIRLERDTGGGFVFGGMPVKKNANAAPPAPDAGKQVMLNAFNRLSHAALMHQLLVTRAIVNVHDDATQKDWAIGVPEISIKRTGLRDIDNTLEYGALEGHMQVEVTQQDGPASLDVHYLYDTKKHQHSLSTVFNSLNPAFLAGGHPETLGFGKAAIADLPLTGKVEAAFDTNMVLAEVEAKIHGDAGQLVYPDFWDKPVHVTAFDVNATFDREAHTLSVSDTHADLDGVGLSLDVAGVPSTLAGQDLDFDVALEVENMPMNRYGELWPKTVLPDPRYWLVANLRDGTFKHAEVGLKGTLAWKDLANISITEGGGKVSANNARVNYLDGMPPAENVSADAVFDLKKMTVQVTSGGIGDIHMQPFAVEITGLADVDQYIHIPLQVSGPVPEIMALIDHPPLGYAKKLGLSPDDLQGKIDGAVDFRFPLLKTLMMKDLEIHASANATALASSKLVPGIAIDQGNFALTLDMSGFGMKGQALLDKVPFQIAWQENFEAQAGQPLRRVDVTGTVKDNQWDNFGINTFDGSKGPVNVTLQMTKPTKKKMVLSGKFDMTAAAMQVDMLGWKKAANAPASLKFVATVPDNEDITINSMDLSGDHVHAAGSAKLSSDMTHLISLNLSPFIIGRSDATVRVTQDNDNGGAMTFDVTGAALDIGGLRSAKDTGQADPRPKQYHIKVAKLYTSTTGEIDNASGFAMRDAQGWSAISLHGLADGNMPLDIDLTPEPDGHRTFKITCNDFGKAMKGLGFTDTIKGGKISVIGASTVDNPRLIIGHAKITDFTVQKLPVLALLLNATSPFGFTGILTDSTDFSRFEGDFNWQGDMITLTRAHAAGSAVGINIDGKVDLNSSEANLQGTLVPFSVVNKMLNYIPLIGDLLTGGEDQGVLAVAYDIKGPLASPKIGVNPVSLLTPGFIRNLFFRDDTADEEEK